MRRAKQFLSTCKSKLGSDSNIFWAALQSNLLADLDEVKDDFNRAFKETKNELSKEGWILPKLEFNMRNQVNISNINVKEGFLSGILKMQSSIDILPSSSTVIGAVPLLFKVHKSDWDKKKESLLKKCIQIMEKKNDKNIIILQDRCSKFKDIENTLKIAVQNKTVLSYPSACKNEQQSIDNVISFSERTNHILITQGKYFNGCEASNVIFLNYQDYGVRNCLFRSVENVICVQLMDDNRDAEIKGMKEDTTFY